MSSGSVPSSSYAARCEAGVSVLAAACGAEETREVERFRAVREALSRAHPAQIFELVLTLTERGPRGFAYLTQGATAHTLPASLHGLLEGALTSYLTQGGDHASALLLADLFASAFPDVGELGRYAPGAQAMVVGFAPRAQDLALKVYFNTRLGTARPHRERVLGMLVRAGLDPAATAATYDALYASTAARFQGVGVDLAPGEPPRAKVYVRCHRAAVSEVARTLASVVGDEARKAIVSLIEEASARLDGVSLADDIELAIALRRVGDVASASCKVTLFFVAELTTAETERRAASFVERHGCDAAPVTALLDALALGDVRRSLHGLGFELGASAKVNVYAMPTR